MDKQLFYYHCITVNLMPKQWYTIWTLFCLLFYSRAQSQVNNPYHLNGSAVQENCNCYTLTPDQNFQSGSVWNINKINLSQPFEFNFDINLGCRDVDGADGLVFVLQPISTSIGSTGGGLGYQGINPSIGIAVDTWQNANDNDPFYDHLAIHKNGDINHNSSNNLAGPVMASNINIEDCQWHSFHIKWDPVTKILLAEIDGKDKVTATINLTDSVFGGNPLVYWGFTGSTGGSRNHQRFCTSLTPGIKSLDNTVTCYPTPIQFSDSSTSFGSILKWQWDFGDGTTDTVRTPAPHVYPAPGNYTVKLNILGNNGCLSDIYQRQVVVGSKPIPAMTLLANSFCEDETLRFFDSSTVQFGTINNRQWSIDNGSFFSSGSDNFLEEKFVTGNHQVALVVSTKEGCVSDPLSRSFTIQPSPSIDMDFEDVCLNSPVLFEGINTNTGLPVSKWYWDFGDGNVDSSSALPSHNYKTGGIYPVKLIALSTNGCYSDTLEESLVVYDTKAFAGADTTVAIGEPFQLKGAGGLLYSWSPSTGLSDPSISNPIAILQGNTSYVLTAFTPIGCATTDTINIRALKGPAIYVPNAFTPNGDGRNDRFRFIPVGMKEIIYFRVFNRYGQLVHSSLNPGIGWDGTLNGRAMPSGTYVWMVSGRNQNGTALELKGTVQLIR